MAQLLKNDIREAIIASSKEEFLKYGYDNASMRRIAANVNTTVGNLYHYFKNKEEIIISIVEPTINKVNRLLEDLTGNSINMDSDNFDLNISKLKTFRIFEELARGIVDIYFEHKDEFRILLLNSKTNKKIVDWFTTLISYIIKIRYGEIKKKQTTFVRAISVGIIDGIKEFFIVDDIEKDDLIKMLKEYFKAYISMLKIRIVR